VHQGRGYLHAKRHRIMQTARHAIFPDQQAVLLILVSRRKARLRKERDAPGKRPSLTSSALRHPRSAHFHFLLKSPQPLLLEIKVSPI